MIITKETDYAIRVLRALQDPAQVSIKALALNEQIPAQYIYKIVQKLSGGGFVSVTKGRYGGIKRSCDLEEVSLLDVVKHMEGDIAICCCGRESYECAWRRAHGECSVNGHLCRIQDQLNKWMESVSMHDLFTQSAE